MAAQEGDSEDQAGSRFPFIPLERAIARARLIHKNSGEHPVPVGDLLKLWGYTEKASGWRQTLAALKYYGLIQSLGVKDGRKVKLTDDARRYFLDERPEEHAKAHKKFALAPSAMETLWTKWRDAPPSDPIARSKLKLDFNYAENAAAQLLSVYKANIAFAALTKTGEDSVVGSMQPAPDAEPKTEPVARAAVVHNEGLASATYATPPQPRQERKGGLMENERVLSDGILSKTATYRLIVTGDVGMKEIERLIKKLEIDKEILADDDADSVSGTA